MMPGVSVRGPAANPVTDWMRVLFEAIDDAVLVHDGVGELRPTRPPAAAWAIRARRCCA